MGEVGVGNFLGELEYTWYSSRSSLPSQTRVIYSINDHKKTYYSRGSIPATTLKTLNQMEREWLSLITGLSINQDLQALWASAAAQYTSATPERGIVPNKILFYSGATLD